jgi:hypothetical protein
MKKSELKKRLVEALTPDEAAKVEPKYKETYAAMIKGKGPLKLKKYDNPDAVVRGRVVNTIKNESLKLAEKLGKTADIGDYKDDFRKSDAPQFKGKSKKKRDQMATAAFLNKEDQNLDEEITNATFQKHADRVESLLRQLIGATKEVDSSQDDTEEDVEELDQSIDYLAAALTDKDPIDIAVDQATFGRLAKPTKEEKTLEEIDAMMEESAYEAGRKAKDAKDKSEKNYSNYFKKMDKNRLEELVKVALMGPMNETSTDKYDDNPALKGKQSELPDGLQKSIIKKKGGKVDEIYSANSGTYIDPSNDYKEYKAKEMEKVDKTTLQIQKVVSIMSDAYMALAKELQGTTNPKVIKYMDGMAEEIKNLKRMLKGMTNESFDSLVKKVDKSKGYTKKEAEKVAGSIAAKKMKGAGKGPTAKQKKRMAETILKELRGNINEVDATPQVAADKAIKTLATKLEKSPEMDKLAGKVAKDPKLMAQLEKAVKDAGVNIELAEDESGLDMGDMKTMALNLAKKSKSVNEKQEYLDDEDGSLDVGLGMASFVGGGSLGAAFGSAILSAVPAVASVFAGPALLGAAAGVGLFLLARKAYLSGQNNPIEF